jgi:hypothetical protein
MQYRTKADVIKATMRLLNAYIVSHNGRLCICPSDMRPVSFACGDPMDVECAVDLVSSNCSRRRKREEIEGGAALAFLLPSATPLIIPDDVPFVYDCSFGSVFRVCTQSEEKGGSAPAHSRTARFCEHRSIATGACKTHEQTDAWTQHTNMQSNVERPARTSDVDAASEAQASPTSSSGCRERQEEAENLARNFETQKRELWVR